LLHVQSKAEQGKGKEGERGLRKEFTERKKNAGVRTQKRKKEKGDTKRSTSR
jgi:hypothetical protein